MKHFLLYLLLFIFFISCNREIIDSRCIIFNLYTSKKVPSHSITLDFKDKSRVYRQVKVKRIQNHQNSLTTNVKGASLG